MKKPPEKPSTIKPLDENSLETFIIIPPDGGWGWVILFVAFVSNFVADGTIYTFGIFIDDISKSIAGTTPETIAITNSLMTGCYYLTAPFVSALTNQCGYRVVSVTGAIMAASVHLYQSYNPTLLTTYFVYGTIAGMGFGMMYVPTLIAISFYFEKWRALTSSIAATGSALGIFAFPLIFKVALKHNTWQENFRIITCMILTAGMLCLLYRQLEPVRVVSVGNTKGVQDDGRAARSSITKYHNTSFPTSSNVHGKQEVAIVQPTTYSTGAELPKPSALKSKSEFRREKASYLGKRIVTLIEEVEEFYDDQAYHYEEHGKCRNCLNKCKNCCCCKCCPCSSKCCQCLPCCRRSSSVPARPMYRDDIFYRASLANLPPYAESVRQGAGGSAAQEHYSIDYHMHVTRGTTTKDLLEAQKCVVCPESIKRTLATMMDMSLLKSPSFFVFVLSSVSSTLGMFTPIMLMTDRAKSYGISEEIAASLITVVGISNTCGRILCGILSSIPGVNGLAVSRTFLTICGISTLLSPMSRSIQTQVLYASVFAMTIACIAALKSIIIVELVGLEKLTNACGLCLLFQGFACLIGVPIAVYLKRTTSSYDAPFYYAGSCILFGGILLMIIIPVIRYEKRART